MNAQKYLLKKYPHLGKNEFENATIHSLSIKNIIDTMEEYSSHAYDDYTRNGIEQIEISITLENGKINKAIFISKVKIRELMKDDTLNKLLTNIIANAE